MLCYARRWEGGGGPVIIPGFLLGLTGFYTALGEFKYQTQAPDNKRK